MPEPSSNDLFNLIRSDLRDFRSEVNKRLDTLVSQSSFDAERRRVDDRLKDLADDIAAEREARTLAVEQERLARKRYEEAEGKKNERTGIWVRWGVTAAIGIPAAYWAWAAFIAGGAG